MNILTRFVVAAILMFGIADAASAEPVVADVAAQERTAWDLACEWKQFDCSRIKPPIVVYRHLGDKWGQYNWGAVEVIVDAPVRGTNFGGLVMIHEFVHYIQFAQGYHNRFSREFRGACAREKEAFQAETQIAEALQIVDLRINTWEEMATSYGCQV